MRHFSLLLAFIGVVNFTSCKPRTISDESATKDQKSDKASVKVDPPRSGIAVDSGFIPVEDSELGLYADYAWYDTKTKKREQSLDIGPKSLEMINAAQKFIVASAFLFDCMYPADHVPSANLEGIVKAYTEALIAKKATNPKMLIVMILDPINRSYADHYPEAVKALNDAGIDIFYTDLLQTPAAAKTGITQAFHKMNITAAQLQEILKLIESSGILNSDLGALPQIAKIKPQVDALAAGEALKDENGKPMLFDGVQPMNLEFLYNIALLKANHRKLLVTDNGSGLEALVSSANPHNASIPSANFAISVKGQVAESVYTTIREDIRHSIAMSQAPDVVAKNFSTRYARWATNRQAASIGRYFTDEFLPIESFEFRPETADKPGVSPEARFVTETKIRDAVLEILNSTQPDDRVRIQMFYLSLQPIVDAIVKVANDPKRSAKNPVQIILDPNKDAFARVKDGTPNRQVARFLRNSSKKLQVRWYDTHGEQNHAKIMTITNDKTGKYVITTGSANWTGKNINGPNMESNVVVRGSANLNKKFNTYFDTFWNNSTPGREHTIDFSGTSTTGGKYDDPNKPEDSKWTKGEASGLVAW